MYPANNFQLSPVGFWFSVVLRSLRTDVLSFPHVFLTLPLLNQGQRVFFHFYIVCLVLSMSITPLDFLLYHSPYSSRFSQKPQYFFFIRVPLLFPVLSNDITRLPCFLTLIFIYIPLISYFSFYLCFCTSVDISPSICCILFTVFDSEGL